MENPVSTSLGKPLKPRRIRKSSMPSAMDIVALKEFVLNKWVRHVDEIGLPPPIDLSGSCKFSAEFCARLYDGKVMGSSWHSWCELPSGRILDLNADARDVSMLKKGKVPYILWGIEPPADEDDEEHENYIFPPESPDDLYEHNEELQDSSFERAEMRMVADVVTGWLVDWKARIQSLDVDATSPRIP